jgi:hypothetical protein
MALTVTGGGGFSGGRISFRTNVSGDNTLIAAPGAGKCLVIKSYCLIGVGTDVGVYFKTGTTAHLGGSDLFITLSAAGPAGGMVLGNNDDGWFAGAANESLVLNLSASQGVIGFVTYDIR